jgi:hypothetical protein
VGIVPEHQEADLQAGLAGAHSFAAAHSQWHIEEWVAAVGMFAVGVVAHTQRHQSLVAHKDPYVAVDSHYSAVQSSAAVHKDVAVIGIRYHGLRPDIHVAPPSDCDTTHQLARPPEVSGDVLRSVPCLAVSCQIWHSSLQRLLGFGTVLVRPVVWLPFH